MNSIGLLENKKERDVSLDLLRSIALLAVIFVHCSGISKDALYDLSTEEKILLFLSSIVTWQVPIYVMISGRFFLDPSKDVSYRKIVKAIIRIIIAFVMWNLIYQIFYFVTGQYDNLNWKGIIMQYFIAPYHFWFLFMIVCLYMVTPFLRKIAENKILMQYFIVLFFVFSFLNGYVVQFPVIGEVLVIILNKACFHFAVGYSGYYILGYYLYKYQLSERAERILYLVAIILVLITGIATVYRSVIEGVNNEWYTKYLLPNIIIEAAAIYVFFIKHIAIHKFSVHIAGVITKLSELSFGVYLVHALIAGILYQSRIVVVGKSALLTTFVEVVVVYCFSNILIYVIRKIPYVGKKIT